MSKYNKKKDRQAPISELLEPRVLFSADSLSLLGGALLPDEIVDNNTLLDFNPDLDSSTNEPTSEKVEVVFIDSRVPELQTFIDDIKENNTSSVTIIVIDQTESGIAVIENALAEFDNVDAIHLVSHSFGTSVRLGSDFLSSHSIDEHASSLSTWGNVLSADADVLIYGCDLGSSVDGLNLMNELASLTGSDVAVSSNDTGHASLGGDWVFEHASGSIEASVLASEQFQASWEHTLANWNSTTRILEVSYKGDKFDNSLTYNTVTDLTISAGNAGVDISLREAIHAINNEGSSDTTTIMLEAGFYDVIGISNDEDNGDPPGPDNNLSNDLDILQPITIIGAGTSGLDTAAATVDTSTSTAIRAVIGSGVGAGNTRVLDAHDTNISLTGLIIAGGKTDHEGAGLRLKNTGAVIDDVVFFENQSFDNDGGGLFSDHGSIDGLQITNSQFFGNDARHGGAMRVNNEQPSASVDITNVLFQENEAYIWTSNVTWDRGNGGAIHSNAQTNITNSTFIDNDAQHGAAIYINSSGDTTITNTEFTLNTAAAGSNSNGGAIYASGDLTLNNSSLFENSANDHGGAVFIGTNSTSTINDTTIENNTAADNGGGIYSLGQLSVTNSFVNNNTAGLDGGGIHASNTIEIVDTEIKANKTSNDDGGGIFLDSNANMEMQGSTVEGNTAKSSGGGMFIEITATADIKQSTFENNIAETDLGGGIKKLGEDPNTAGADPDSQGVFRIDDSIFRGNKAIVGEGGAISVWGDITILNSTFHENEGGNSGAIRLSWSDNSEIENSTFFQNKAIQTYSPNPLNVFETIEDNDAGYAGAIYVYDSNLAIKNSTIVNNTSFRGNSAIQFFAPNEESSSFNVTLTNSIVAENDATDRSTTQLDKRVISTGFNVIESVNGIGESEFTPSFNDIMDSDPLSPTVNASLESSLTKGDTTHAEHLKLISDSDAIDAGGGDSRVDAFGVLSNEYIDAGAVEYKTPSTITKIYFVDENDQSIYRMNENGRAIQQIVEPRAPLGLNQEILDIAFDNKTQQLFFLQYTPEDTGDDYDIFIADKDGNIDPGTHLSMGGADTSDAGTEGYKPYGLATHEIFSMAVKENTDPNTPNELFITGNESTNNGFILTFNISEDKDGFYDTSKTWVSSTGLFGPFQDYVQTGGSIHKAVSIDVVAYPTDPTKGFVVLADQGTLDPGQFHTYNTADLVPAQPIYLTNSDATPVDYNDVTAAAFNADDNILYASLKDETRALNGAGFNNTAFSYTNPTTSQTSDSEFDDNLDRLWLSALDSRPNVSGTIGYLDSGFTNSIVNVDLVEHAPVSIALAAVSNVSTNPSPRNLVNESLDIDENESNKILNTHLEFEDDIDFFFTKNNPENVAYTLTELPQEGTLLVNNVAVTSTDPSPNSHHFTQADIDNGIVEYAHGSGEINTDNFSFGVSDGTTSVPGTFTINIAPVNDAPSLSLSETSKTILESATGVTFGTVTVSDPDSPTPNITVTDAAGNASPYVELIGDTLTQIDGVNFDFEGGSTIDFYVEAIDDVGAKSTRIPYTITLEDVNEAPTIANPVTGLSATELTPFTFSIPSNVFADQDAGDDTNLTISVVGTLPSWLSYDAPTKTLSGTPEDVDAGQTAEVILVATDDDPVAPLSSPQMKFQIPIADINQAPTDIKLQESAGTNVIATDTFQVKENVAGQVVGVLSTEDPDASDINPSVHTYAITSQTGNQFEIVGNQLKLKDGQSLNYESSPNVFNVEITSSDVDKSIAKTFTITVDDVNENPGFILENQRLTIPEFTTDIIPANYNRVLADLNAADPDNGNVLTARVTDVDGNIHEFVEVVNGKVQLKSSYTPNFEDLNTFVFKLQVLDNNGGSSANVPFTVNITNANDPVTLQGPVSANIDENKTGLLNAADGNTLAAFSVADEDTNNTYNYTVLNTIAESAMFFVNANNQLELFSQYKQDFESGLHSTSFTLKIQVEDTSPSDGTSKTDTLDITVDINDVNDAPVIINPISDRTIDETDTLNLSIQPNSVNQANTFEDEDANDNLTINVTGKEGAPRPGWLTYNSNTGILSGTPQDADAGQTFELEAYATDDAAPSLKSQISRFTISVNNINQAPTGITLTTTDNTLNVSELEPGLIIGDLATIDPDFDDVNNLVHTYTIVSSTSAAPLEIIGNELKLQNNQAFDYNQEQSVSITVESTDGANESTIETFTLNIQNVNEAPSFTLSNQVLTINESDENVVFGTVNVSDPDQDGLPIDILLTDANGDPHPYVELDGNKIRQSVEFDHEQMSSFEFYIQVEDEPLNPNDKKASPRVPFQVVIQDINEAPTVDNTMEQQFVKQLESLSFTIPDDIFGDQDENTVLSYQATPVNNSVVPNWLSFNNNTGEFSGTPTENDPLTDIDFEITATDNGTPSLSTQQTAPLTISVVEVNQKPTDIALDSDSGTLDYPELTASLELGSLSTVDGDAIDEDLHIYTFVNSNDSERYEINGNKLKLKQGEFFDYNNEQTILIPIRSTDPSSEFFEKTFVINVTNVNEAPVFTLSNQNLSINESETNVEFGEINASDPDDDGNPLSITLTDANGNESAYVELAGNKIVQKQGAVFDHEADSSFDFHIEVKDSDNLVSLNNSVGGYNGDNGQYTVNIADLNERPELTAQAITMSLAELDDLNLNIPASAFTDQDENTDLVLTLSSTDESGVPAWINFNQNTWTLSGTPQDADSGKQHNLLLTASDGLLTSQSLPINITVTEINQQPESIVLESSNDTLSVNELAPGAIIGSLSTIDPDRLDQHTYTTTNSDFAIDDNTLKLDRFSFLDVDDDDIQIIDGKPTITIEVTSTDNAGLAITQAFNIIVNDINEAPLVDSATVTALDLENNPLSLSNGSALDLSIIPFSDPEDNEIRYSVVSPVPGESLPAWISFDEETRILTINSAPPQDISSIDLVLQADDGQKSTNFAFTAAVSYMEPDLGLAIEEIIEVEQIPTQAVEKQEETVTEAPVEEQAPEQPSSTPEKSSEDSAELEEGIGFIDSGDSIDLASLIKPIDKVNFSEIESTDNSISSVNRELTITNVESIESSLTWLDMSSAFSQPSDIEFTELAHEFDRQREELAERAASNRTLIGSSFTLSSGLSVGYLLWLIRGGTLMGSVLSSLPAWRLVDPLPVLGSLGGDLDDDDESLESMVDNEEENTDPPPAEAA